MKLTQFSNNTYYVTCRYGEKASVKEAGFKWDSVKKQWYSDDIYKVIEAVKSLNIQDIPDQLKLRIGNIESSYADTPRDKNPDIRPSLFDYQKRGVEELHIRDNVLLADDPGCGKTLQVVQYVSELPKDTKILVICPASLKINWQREFKKWAGIESAVVANGNQRILDIKERVVIVNYDILKSKLISDHIERSSFGVLVCDEAHYIKNTKTARSKKVKKIAQKVAKIIFITGTPLLSRPVELYSLLNILGSEDILKPYENYRNFAYRFCKAYNSPWGLDVSGNSNVKELALRMRSSCLVRRLKKQVLHQLPDRTKHIIPLAQCTKTKKIMTKQGTFHFGDVESAAPFAQLGEIAQMRKALALAKIKESVRYIKDLLNNTQKVVVFAHHTEVLKTLYTELADYNPVIFTGKHGMKHRQTAVDSFQEDHETRVFIGQIQAAGTGITLTSASNVVFVEISWVPGEINQAMDRCHRIGQTSNVTARFLVVEGSLDEQMLSAIEKKEKVIKEIID